MKAILARIGSLITDITQTLAISLSVWLLAYLFLGHGTKIYGSSMEPAFHNEQGVFTDTFSYHFSSPQRGDVIPPHAPPAAGCVSGTGGDFFKRIIGIPGEDVAVHDDAYYINGQKLVESYIPETEQTLSGPFIDGRTIHLGSNEYFVSGDNREHSSDSRFWGPITQDEIIGKAILRYCPTKDLGILPRVSYQW